MPKVDLAQADLSRKEFRTINGSSELLDAELFVNADFFNEAAQTTATLKAYNGSAWVTGTLKRWTGTVWENVTIKYWNNSSWV